MKFQVAAEMVQINTQLKRCYGMRGAGFLWKH